MANRNPFDVLDVENGSKKRWKQREKVQTEIPKYKILSRVIKEVVTHNQDVPGHLSPTTATSHTFTFQKDVHSRESSTDSGELRHQISEPAAIEDSAPIPATEDMVIKKFIQLVKDYELDCNSDSHTARNLQKRLAHISQWYSNIDWSELQDCVTKCRYQMSPTGSVLMQLRTEGYHLRCVLNRIMMHKNGVKALRQLLGTKWLNN